MPTHLSREDDREIARLYQSGLNALEIADRIGRQPRTVSKSLHRSGISIRPKARLYVPRDDFFSTIDSDAKAYWLGFLAADGCVRDNRVSLRLQKRDCGHVEKWRDEISPYSPLRFLPPSRKGGGPQCEVNFHSRQIVADLARNGITPRKSLTIQPWDGPPEMLAAYYRGLIDGDGWWRYSARNDSNGIRCMVGLIATTSVALAFRDFIYDRTGASPAALQPHHTTEGLLSVEYRRLSAVQEVARLLFKGATVWLDRKKETVERVLAKPLSSLSRSIRHSKTTPDPHPFWHTQSQRWKVRINGRTVALPIRDDRARATAEAAVDAILRIEGLRA